MSETLTAPPSVKTAPIAPVAPKTTAQTANEELDSMFDASDKKPEPKVEAKAEVKEPIKEPVKEEVEPEEPKLIGEDDAEEPKPEVKGNDKPAGTAKELRSALDNTKKQVQALKQEIEALKKGKTEDPERKTIMDKLQAEENRRKELEQEIGVVRYEKTQEYHEKFQKPLETAFKTAYEEVQQLSVETAEGARKGSTDDFNKLMYLPLQEAIATAKELFGDAATEVLAHRRRILEMNASRKEAIDNHVKTRDEREKNQTIEQERQREMTSQLWDKTKNDQVEKFPTYFKPKEGDEEGNKVLEKGYKIADLAFSNPDLPIEKKIQLHATIRNKAASFDRLALENKRAQSKIESLEKELAEFKKSEPGEGAGTPEKTAKVMTAFEELDALAK